MFLGNGYSGDNNWRGAQGDRIMARRVTAGAAAKTALVLTKIHTSMYIQLPGRVLK
jgi:hypothetical protein